MIKTITTLILLITGLNAYSADFTIQLQPAQNSVSDNEVSSVSSIKISDFTSAVTSIVNSILQNISNQPTYIDATLSLAETQFSPVNSWVDVPGTITINPSGTESWEVSYEGLATAYSLTSLEFDGSIGIFDSDNNLIDNSITTVRHLAIGTSIGAFFPISLTARVSINSSKTYKLRIRASANSGGATLYLGEKNITSSFSSTSIPNESGEKFYARKIK